MATAAAAVLIGTNEVNKVWIELCACIGALVGAPMSRLVADGDDFAKFGPPVGALV